MKNMKGWTFLTILILFTVRVGAATFYVAVANPAPAAPFANWSTAATNIQNAIDLATNGDLILITNGVYATGGRMVYNTRTNRVVINKAVTVQSVSGPAATIIQGYQIPSSSTAYNKNVRCVYMTNNAVLAGFTIANGAAGGTVTDPKSYAGGGVYCESTNAVLTNCVLTGNLCASGFSSSVAVGGGAVYQGTLNNCVLSNNSVTLYNVAGGAACSSLLNYCLLCSNSASIGGGAAYSTLNHCTVLGNIAPFIGGLSWGGGTYICSVTYCLIAGNVCSGGGGDCFGILNYCILSTMYASCHRQAATGREAEATKTHTVEVPRCSIIASWSATVAMAMEMASILIQRGPGWS